MNRNLYLSQEQIALQMEYIEKLSALTQGFKHNRGRAMAAYVETFGCQQNENDTERICGMLYQAGFELADERKAADVILFNTCAVRENAELKVLGNIGALKHWKEQNPELVIGLCGCMMQQEHIAEEVRRKYKQVDLVFGTHALYRFPELLYRVLTARERVFELGGGDTIAEDLPIYRKTGLQAWVSIMYGCNNFCSYCIVPYVRGRERSRRPERILEEVKNLAGDGVKEITLLGQNVNSYGNHSDFHEDFAELLSMVCRIDGIERVRFMTSHPKDISDRLIEVMANEKKVCKMLHLPVQSGNNRVLEAMNRKYTREEYFAKIEKARVAMPGLALSTDIIVGFPGETEEEFEDTLDLIRKVRYDNVYSFLYSKREGTAAAGFDDPFSHEEKQKWFERLLEVQNEIALALNQTYEGKIYDVLVEGASKTNPDVMTGRTDTNKIINFPGNESMVGNLVPVKVTKAHTWSLNGEVWRNENADE